MDDDPVTSAHSTLKYKHVMVRSPSGQWTFYGSPIRFTQANHQIALAVTEVMIRDALAASPWAHIPKDVCVIEAFTLEAFVLMDMKQLDRRNNG